MLRLALLGAPVLTKDDRPVVFDTRKAIAVLAVLAVEHRPCPRERLAALLWPELPDERARGALRRTLSVTTKAVDGALSADRAVVRLAMPVECDVDEFIACASSDVVSDLERAAALFRDDFLAGFSLRDAPDFDDWRFATAEGLRLQLMGVLERLAGALTEAGRLDDAVVVVRRWMRLDPLHEPAHQALIRLLAWTGQRSAALGQFRTCVDVLDRELGVAPLPATRALAEAVRSGRLAPSPAPVVAPRAPDAPAVRSSPSADQAQPPLLVGRDAVLGELRAAATRIGAAGRMVELVGPAGLGKTSAVEAFGREIVGDAGCVLSVRCHDRERGLAYGVAIELLRIAQVQAPAQIAGLPSHVRHEVSRLLPELADPHDKPAEALDGLGAVARLYAAVGDVLVAATAPVAGRARGLVVVDDVQRADGPSADLLGYLLRRLASLPLLLVLPHDGAFDRDSPLPAALADATAAGHAQRIDIAPLDEDEVRALLHGSGASVDDEQLRKLMLDTGGVPFLVTAFARTLREASADGAAPSVPADARTALSNRLAAVSETTQQVLAAAAILDARVDLDLLRAVSGRGESETVDAVEEGVRAGLLVETTAAGARGAYDFPFNALRRVVDERLGAARRRLLHNRAADALLRRDGVPAGAVARHLALAGRDIEAAHWHWQAALDARRLFAHAEALAHVEQARMLGWSLTDSRLAAGELLTLLGRYDEALSAYEAAAAVTDLSDENDAASRGRLAVIEHRLADVHHRLGDYAVADDHARAALEILGTTDESAASALSARVVADRALLAFRQGDAGRAGEFAARAREEATAAADDAAAAQALDVLGMLAAHAGDLNAAEELLEQSLGHARSLADPSSMVAALNNLARVYADRGDADRALGAAQEALTLGTAHGDRHRAAALHTNLADLLYALDRRDEAMTHLKEAAALFAGVDDASARRPEIWKLVEW